MKTVFITGAANGIGLATARKFAANGWFVGLFDIDNESISKLLETTEFAQACGCYCDVSDRNSISDAIDYFCSRSGGKMDALINNAGVLSGGEFEKMEQHNVHAMIDINIKGMTDVAHLAFPVLKSTGNSTLVNICSASSIYGFPLLAVYSATKFYVRGLTEALNLEWKKSGVHVSCVKPPYVKTAMFDAIPERATEKVSAEFTPQQVANVVYQAATGNRVAYIIGKKIKLWDQLVRLFPNSIGKYITRYLANP